MRHGVANKGTRNEDLFRHAGFKKVVREVAAEGSDGTANWPTLALVAIGKCGTTADLRGRHSV